jgi:hypothetical protein
MFGYSSGMLHIREHKWVKTGSKDSRLQFETESFSRYLVLDGKRAYTLGLCCQTCSLLFERLSGANQTAEIEATAEALRARVNTLNDEVVDIVGKGLPEGEYAALLADTPVRQASPGDANDYFSHELIELWGEDNFWCLPHDPRISYFRAGDRDLGQGRRLFNFIVPMFPTKWLSMTTVEKYKEALRTKASGTAISIAVLEIRSPRDGGPNQNSQVMEHWCLTHYLLDGHHKLNAAFEAGKPLELLSFIALSEGISTREQVDEAVSALSAH